MSDSVRPYGLQPTRLLCPWGFSRQEYQCGLPCPPPGDLINPVIKHTSLGRWVLYHQHHLGSPNRLPSVQSLSRVRLFVDLWTAPHKASLSVHHQFLELVQTHVHRVNDVIQPSHPRLSLSPPAFNLLQLSGSFLLSWLFTSRG